MNNCDTNLENVSYLAHCPRSAIHFADLLNLYLRQMRLASFFHAAIASLRAVTRSVITSVDTVLAVMN